MLAIDNTGKLFVTLKHGFHRLKRISRIKKDFLEDFFENLKTLIHKN